MSNEVASAMTPHPMGWGNLPKKERNMVWLENEIHFISNGRIGRIETLDLGLFSNCHWMR